VGDAIATFSDIVFWCRADLGVGQFSPNLRLTRASSPMTLQEMLPSEALIRLAMFLGMFTLMSLWE